MMQKYLVFMLGNEKYGIPIHQVKEIIGMADYTDVPQTPDFLIGVMNLRGKIISVFDLRVRFGMVFQHYTKRNCTVVVESYDDGYKRFSGLIVDSVSEVVEFEDHEIEYNERLSDGHEDIFITSICRKEDLMVILLDVVKIVELEENFKEILAI